MEKKSQISATRIEDSFSEKDYFEDLGSSWTAVYSGFIEEDFNSKLRFPMNVKIYEEMRRSDAQVNASLLAMELPIRSTKWSVEASQNEEWESDEQSREIAEFVENCLFDYLDTTWDDLLRQILTMLPFWFSVFEKVYGFKEIDGQKKVVLSKLWLRKQDSIQKWECEDGSAGVTQILPTAKIDWTNEWDTQISIPWWKLLVFSYRREGDNYEGISALRSAYKHWYIKDKLYKFEAIKHEKQSVGIPIINLPDNAGSDDIAKAKALIRDLRATQTTGIVLPWSKSKWWELTFVDLKSSNTSNVQETIKHHNREIVKNILAQFLELWDTASGSRSLWESQTSLFLLSLWAIAKQVADTINKYLIPELVNFNYEGVTDYPKLTFQKLWEEDINLFATTLSTLSGAGMITADKELEAHLRTKLDLPAKSEDEMEDVEDDGEVEETMETETDVVWELPTEDDWKIVDAVEKEKEITMKKKKYHDHSSCSHNKGFFDDRYFNSVSKIIDNNYIIKLQNGQRGA